MESYVALLLSPVSIVELLIVYLFHKSKLFTKFVKYVAYLAIFQGLLLAVLLPERQQKVSMSSKQFFGDQSYTVEKTYKPRALIPGTAVIKVRAGMYKNNTKKAGLKSFFFF